MDSISANNLAHTTFLTVRCQPGVNVKVGSSMKRLSKCLGCIASIGVLALAGCATEYQPQGLTGGFSDYLSAPDIAVVMFHGNGYTSDERAGQMVTLRCADVTLEHGYRYFMPLGAADTSSQASFSTPGFATTNIYGHGNYYGFGSFGTYNGSATASTVVTPSQTFRIRKPGYMVAIKMSNDLNSLKSIETVIGGVKQYPEDAAFLSKSFRQFLGIKSQG